MAVTVEINNGRSHEIQDDGDMLMGDLTDGAPHSFVFSAQSPNTATIFFGDDASQVQGHVSYDHNVNSMSLATQAITRILISQSGNVAMSANHLGTGGAVFIIENGSVPTANLNNSVQLYSQDIAASAELRVRDEAGNITTLSPHSWGRFKPSERMAWAYRSERDDFEVFCDVMAAMREIEFLSEQVRGAGLGKKLVHIYDLANPDPDRPPVRPSAPDYVALRGKGPAVNPVKPAPPPQRPGPSPPRPPPVLRP